MLVALAVSIAAVPRVEAARMPGMMDAMRVEAEARVLGEQGERERGDKRKGARSAKLDAFHDSCPRLPWPSAPAKDVHSVRVQDIRGVIALGDSITAGFGSEGGFLEYRGSSWCIGGDVGELTMPNLLGAVQPEGAPQLEGMSVGAHMPEICMGPAFCPRGQRRHGDLLNAAQSGARAGNLVHQASFLVEQAKTTLEPEETGWHVATVLIGANEVCNVCTMSEDVRADLVVRHEADLRQALEVLREGIPRLIVNLVAIFNFEEVLDIGRDDPYCRHRRLVSHLECMCALENDENTESNHRTMREYADIFRGISANITADYHDEDFDTFAVTLHKFGYGTNLSAFPVEFVSSLDCFHPSIIAHQSFATALWNSMLTPFESRSDQITHDETPMCPGADGGRIYI